MKTVIKKQELLDKLIAKLEDERQLLAEAARQTYEAATHEESEAEDQYDTRGLEASYLAGAQAKRVAEVEQTILTLKQIKLRDFKDGEGVAVTAFVELEHEGKQHHCFLLPMGGGQAIDFDNRHVQVITPRSPLGEALLGRETGDVASVDVGKETIEYEIVSVS